jgi:hypothetical protein
LLTPTGTAAKKVLDKKVGVLVGSSEFHVSTRLFESIGVCEPKYAYPHKKRRGKEYDKEEFVGKFVFGFRARGNGHERYGASLVERRLGHKP